MSANQSTPAVALKSRPSERSWPRKVSGSGISRIARTMLRFADRHEEIATVTNVITTPNR